MSKANQFIRLFEEVGSTKNIHQLASKKDTLLPSLIYGMDGRSVAVIFEVGYDTPLEELASEWFDSLIQLYTLSTKQGVTVFRHMYVQDFSSFITSLQDGTGHVGEYWSLNYNIESPTWRQDQKGDSPVLLQGALDPGQVDWEATMRQNFAYPHEGEVIFSGDVFVTRAEDLSENVSVKIGKLCKR
jgi:hypothetical protein